MARLDYL